MSPFGEHKSLQARSEPAHRLGAPLVGGDQLRPGNIPGWRLSGQFSQAGRVDLRADSSAPVAAHVDDRRCSVQSLESNAVAEVHELLPPHSPANTSLNASVPASAAAQALRLVAELVVAKGLAGTLILAATDCPGPPAGFTVLRRTAVASPVLG